MELPPRDPWHRRYRYYYATPYPGCGCLYLILFALLLWWLITWAFAPYYYYHR